MQVLNSVLNFERHFLRQNFTWSSSLSLVFKKNKSFYRFSPLPNSIGCKFDRVESPLIPMFLPLINTPLFIRIEDSTYARFSRRCTEQDTGWVDQMSMCLKMSPLDFRALSADWYTVASMEMCGMNVDVDKENSIRRSIKKHRVCKIGKRFLLDFQKNFVIN